MTSLLIAREGGPQASELTAHDRAAWARHLDRLPPASVAIARATRLILLALGVKADELDKLLWWGRMPTFSGYPEQSGPKPAPSGASADGDPLVNMVLGHA